MGSTTTWPRLSPELFETTLATIFESAVRQAPEHPWLSFEGAEVTLAQTARHAEALAQTAAAAGVRPGDRVAALIDTHPDSVASILALSRMGAVWVPLDTRAPAAALAPRLALARPVAAIADPHHHDALRAAGFKGPLLIPAEARAPGELTPGPSPSLASSTWIDAQRSPDDHRAILFTSGTTGAPKGVIVTERMFCAAGRFAALAGRADAQQTFLLWEPLNHIGGAQMIPAALISGARLAMVPRFSASAFWRQAKIAGATRMHYLGGVLDLLAKRPPDPKDRDHGVTHGFGAAARPEMWVLFPERFGVTLTEVYGQTEAASFCIVNQEGRPGAIGRALPEFDVALRTTDGDLRTEGAGEGRSSYAAIRPDC